MSSRTIPGVTSRSLSSFLLSVNNPFSALNDLSTSDYETDEDDNAGNIGMGMHMDMDNNVLSVAVTNGRRGVGRPRGATIARQQQRSCEATKVRRGYNTFITMDGRQR